MQKHEIILSVLIVGHSAIELFERRCLANLLADLNKKSKSTDQIEMHFYYDKARPCMLAKSKLIIENRRGVHLVCRFV